MERQARYRALVEAFETDRHEADEAADVYAAGGRGSAGGG